MSSTEKKAPVVVRGKLNLKGGSTASAGGKKRKATEGASSTTVLQTPSETPSTGQLLTEAQKKHRGARAEVEMRQAKKLVGSTYRERVETFNYKLSKMTEHNDIPRISAAGNG
jgi:protein FAM32A